MKKTFVFDIDDTILFTDLVDGAYTVKKVNKKLVKIINSLYLDNFIVIQTGRHWDKYMITKNQLNQAGVRYDTLIMGNIPADYYVNDKGILPEAFCELYKLK